MNENVHPQSEPWLKLDRQNPALTEKHEAVLHAHFNSHLSGATRLRYVLLGLAGLAGSLVCGSLAITEPATMPKAVRGLLTLFAFFGLGWTLLASWTLARGRGDFINQRTLAARMAFGFTLTSVIALSIVSTFTGHTAVGMPLVATGLAMLIFAVVILINVRIERSESLIREQILRVERRLMEMAEAMEQARKSTPAGG